MRFFYTTSKAKIADKPIKVFIPMFKEDGHKVGDTLLTDPNKEPRSFTHYSGSLGKYITNYGIGEEAILAYTAKKYLNPNHHPTHYNPFGNILFQCEIPVGAKYWESTYNEGLIAATEVKLVRVCKYKRWEGDTKFSN